jgi:predicted nucleic acid-binding protein
VAEPEIVSVFCDADVLIAGSDSKSGASHLILRLGELGLIDVVSSAQARREAERNLSAKLPSALATFGVLVEASCRWVADPADSTLPPMKDWAHPKDLPILGAAIEAACDSLVTFNIRHFEPPKDVIRIETPANFVRRLRKQLARLSD